MESCIVENQDEMPKIIDLFAGAGGLSLGAARAGFGIAAAVELDPFAIETHSKNFPNTVHISEDVASLTGERLFLLTGLKKGEIDGIIGGPPCQGFSYMGKRDVEDTRNDLFGHFFRLVSEMCPSFFVAENVPGILDSKYDAVRNNAFSRIDDRYVLLPPIEVKANHYGAPTTRTRIFFIGYDPKRFRTDLNASDFLPPADVELIVVKTALKGLHQTIDPNWLSEEQGWRPITSLADGRFFERISNTVPKGVGDPASLVRYLEKNQVSGCMGTRHSEDVEKRYEALAYGEADKISKAVRLNPDGYCPTLRAGTAKDKGSYQAVRPIHFKKPRVITPREAARLQGFPDWFVFHRTKWHSFRQIGNSVSPIVSELLLAGIYKKL